MKGQGQNGTRPTPEFPEIEAEIGENPARFLHTKSPSGRARPGDDQTSELALAYARLKAIVDCRTLDLWDEVERRTRDRDHVREKIEQRRLAIYQGERGFAVLETPDEPEPTPEPAETSAEEDSAGDVEIPAAGENTAPGHATETAATDGGRPSYTNRGGDSCPNCKSPVKVHELGGKKALWCSGRCNDFVGRVE